MSRRAWLRAQLLQPVDAAALAVFRMLFGLALGVSMIRFLAFGWVDDFFVQPSFHFKYWGFHWVPAPDPSLAHPLFWGMAGLAVCVAAGFLFRVTSVLFVLGFTYLQLVDVSTYLNHYYLASLLGALLAVSPAHRLWSVDAWLRRRRTGEPPSQTLRAGWLYLLRFQVGVVYTFAGIAKAHGDWLWHAQPLQIWLSSATDMPVLGWVFRQSWAAPVMSWAGFLFDTTIVWFLLFRRTRPFAYLAVIGFHVITGSLFPIGMFPVLMMLSAMLFFSPEWPRRLLDRLGRVRRGLGSSATHASNAASSVPVAVITSDADRTPWSRRHTWLAAAAGVYCAVQLLLPVRFLVYGGNVRWHEQGMRFSWRVMVREKNASLTYVVRHVPSGKIWHVNPRRYLTRLQEREISTQPDLILQLGHHIRADFERRGLGPVEVHADALVSLNGRRLARLIDPEVDLATVQDGLAPAHWILPAPPDDPPHLRPL